MNDLDQQLRGAGVRLRGTAPSAEATEAALVALGDVTLDDRPPARHRWIVAPAVLAAAAAVIGVLVLTRPTEEAIVPATTIPPAPATTVAGAATTVPATTAPATTVVATTSTISAVDLGLGVSLQISDVDFDGDAGACLTLSTPTDRATGCADGPTMRSAYLNSLYVLLDGAAFSLAPTGIDGSGEPELASGETAVPQCVLDAELVGVLVDTASCDGDNGGIIGVLPATADGATTWTVFGAASPATGLEVDLVTASEPTGTRVFRTRATDAVPACLVVESWNHVVRESCGWEGSAGSLLAGSGDRPIVVEYDATAETATVTELDPLLPARANGCSSSVGALLARLARPVAITELRCAGDTAVAGYPFTYVRPGPPVSGTTVLLATGEEPPAPGDPGYSTACDVRADGCAELGTGDEPPGSLLPVPPVAVLTADFGDDLLDPRDVTERYAGIGAVADEAALYTAVDAAWRAIGDTDTLSAPTSAGRSPLLVTFSRIPDDSQESSVLTVWYTNADDGLRIDTVIDVIGCGRGTTESEDGTSVCV